MEQLEVLYDRRLPNIWKNICGFSHILGSPSSYLTLQLLHSEFPYTVYEENLIFFFISASLFYLFKGVAGLWRIISN
jgi:hypothetical protein